MYKSLNIFNGFCEGKNISLEIRNVNYLRKNAELQINNKYIFLYLKPYFVLINKSKEINKINLHLLMKNKVSCYLKIIIQ